MTETPPPLTVGALLRKLALQTIASERSLALRGALVTEAMKRPDAPSVAAIARVCNVERQAIYRWVEAFAESDPSITADELAAILDRIKAEGVKVP